jgi:Flp pilus assembly pilin Flp
LRLLVEVVAHKWANFSSILQGEVSEMVNLIRDESGAELAEYAVAVALLVAIGAIVYSVLGQAISDSNSQTGDDIKNASATVTS